MRRSSWFLVIICAFACTPFLAHAQSVLQPIINLSGGSCTCPGTAPDWGCVLQTIQTIMNDIVAFATIIITIFIAWAGIGYLMSPTSSEGRQKARARVLNAVLGLCVVLAGWLFIDSLMKVIYNSGASAGGVASLGPWNSILSDTNSGDQCIKQVVNIPALPQLNAGSNPNGGGPQAAQPSATGAPANPVGGPIDPNSGSCTPAQGGPCSVANLQNTCWGSNATRASEICVHESGGDPTIKQGTDLLTNENNLPYSVGLFATNLTDAYPIQVDGQNCSAAFSQPCGHTKTYDTLLGGGRCSVTIVNMQLYNDCIASAQTASNGIQAGCILYSKGGWSPWENECTL